MTTANLTSTIHTNGHIDPVALVVEAFDVGPVPVGDLPSLIDQLRQHGGDTDQLKSFALDHVGELADMSKLELARFCELLRSKGVANEWIRSDLRPIVNDEKRNNTAGVTWTDYVRAANDDGFEFRLNDLDDKVEVNGQGMSDVIEAEILSKLHAKGLRNAEVARRAFITDAAKNRYHPVKSYLESLVWDGQDHIRRLYEQYVTDCHDPIEYSDGTKRSVVHAWMRRWHIGAVGKVYDSRLNQNPVPVLDGAQGRGKSYLVAWLGSPLSHLHKEKNIDTNDKDYLSYLTDTWTWEIGELGATLSKTDKNALKQFLTMQEVVVRPPYGRYSVHKPALASFIGTANVSAGLFEDETGNRRFRPVELRDIDWSYCTDIDINQVWAQAYALYKRGETLKLSPEEVPVHEYLCDLYSITDPMKGHIMKYFYLDAKSAPSHMQEGYQEWYLHTTDIMDALRASAGVRDGDRALSMRIAKVLGKYGFNLPQRKIDGTWGYWGIQRKLTS